MGSNELPRQGYVYKGPNNTYWYCPSNSNANKIYSLSSPGEVWSTSGFGNNPELFEELGKLSGFSWLPSNSSVYVSLDNRK